ncbi:helix-turn-helix domain-containing protein [Spirosoma linguale]|uniref:Transcriptional regulator, AraC family n=1 Tax=Spirosoma linguale (strain ATCC 33905 / DSM 74 / LMG 10896 / Claus 1) TaxID=504472 RepID=D2QNZ3_SPILD|nr:transcriptional regulator, AraC family [Spirosoma linguale DSM 74]
MEKPSRTHPVPILTPPDLDKHHFDPDLGWMPTLLSDYHLFHFNRVETYRSHLTFPLSPHRKTVFDFIFLTKGHSIRTKGLDTYEFSANSFFFLPAYQITAHEWMSEDAEGFFCHFDAQIIQKNFSKPDFSAEFPFLQFVGDPIVRTDDDFSSTIHPTLLKLEAEYDQDKPFKLDVVSFCLLSLFTELKRYSHTQIKVRDNSASRITQQYKLALGQHIYQKQSITDYADLLAISPNHLNKCVKNATGKSAQDLLNDMILLEAKVLLRQKDLPVSEIAFKLTRQNPSDFTRFFKAKTGITPKEYKRMD